MMEVVVFFVFVVRCCLNRLWGWWIIVFRIFSELCLVVFYSFSVIFCGYLVGYLIRL